MGEACLRAKRRGDCKIKALTASMFSDDRMGRGTPVLRCVVLPVCLNIVTNVTIDFRSGTESFGTTLKRFQKVLQSQTVDSKSRMRRQNARSSLLQRMIAIDCISKETLESRL